MNEYVNEGLLNHIALLLIIGSTWASKKKLTNFGFVL